MSTVCVFVPCYNYARFLRQCVASILSQSGVELRVLIIDDASTDDTPAVAAELCAADARVAYMRHGANRGHIATYNEGLAWAEHGDYTVLLSADDMLTPGALGRAVALMQAHPEVGFVFGPAVQMVSGQPLPAAAAGDGSQRLWAGADLIRAICRTAYNPVPAPAVVTRTSLQRIVGGYRPSLPHAGDMEMWLRFAAYGAVGEICDAHQAYYRIHSQNMHIRQFSAHLAELRQIRLVFETFFEEHGPCLADLEGLRAAARRMVARKALGAAGSAFDDGAISPAGVQELTTFALDTDPGAWRTSEYLGLRARALLGRRRLWLVHALRGLLSPGGLRAGPKGPPIIRP